MLDIKVIRENPELVKAGALKKRMPDRIAAVDRVLQLDGELRALLPKIEGMRAEQKAAGKSIGKLSPSEREQYLVQQKALKDQLGLLEQTEKDLRADLDKAMLLIPNIPAPEVPEGKDDTENQELRRVGTVPKFSFAARSHHELGEKQGWLEFERAAAIAGSRTYFLFGDLAYLHDAVLRFACDHMIAKGFTLVDPPLLVRDFAMTGTAFFPGGEEQAYRAERDELNLIGTSEVPTTSIHQGEILEEDSLPKLFVARSACFRREAGTYGKDTKGLYRVHQFHKVEQVIVDIGDVERSKKHHEAITKNSEEILQAFELPYRVVAVCGGDLGTPQIFKYDIETWMPSRNGYGETHSSSRFHEFQARRLNLRYRRKEDKKVAFCHTLNNTVIASPRVLIALLEIHQQQDGKVRIPEALVPYMNGKKVIGKSL